MRKLIDFFWEWKMRILYYWKYGKKIVYKSKGFIDYGDIFMVRPGRIDTNHELYELYEDLKKRKQ